MSADAERISEACEGLGLVALTRGDAERASVYILHEALESASDPDRGSASTSTPG